MAIEIDPSPEARQLFNKMVDRASVNGDSKMHLSLAHTIELSVVLTRQGGDVMTVNSAVSELQEAAWIAPGSDGGWSLG